MAAAFTHVASGKVREIYAAGDEMVLVATDRISAYDVVFDEAVPDRGRILTQMSKFWCGRLGEVVPTHLVRTIDTAADAAALDLPAADGDPSADPAWLAGRTTVARRADMFPLECIVRGYLYGSAWREYDATGAVPGLELPAGMRLAERLPTPMFSPSTKAAEGHDELIDMDAARDLVGADIADELARLSIAVYTRCADHARAHGLILADTKFEFGLIDGRIHLCDEVCTPDSSRYWYVDDWAPGIDPPAFDKQFLRRYLDGLDWDKCPPAPHLPDEVVAATRARYAEAYEVVVGTPFAWPPVDTAGSSAAST